MEFNITQVETGLTYASACLKHIKQITTAHKANVSIHQELILLQSIAEAEIQEIYESYKHLMEFFTDLNPKELHKQNLSTISLSSGGGTQIIANKVESFTSNISPVRNKRQLGIFLGLAGLIGGATLYGFLQTEKVSEIEDNLQNLAYRQDKIMHLISTQNKEVATNRNHISYLGTMVYQIQRIITSEHTTLKIETATMYIRHLMGQIRTLLNKYMAIISAASVQRLATQAITSVGASRALADIRALAATKGLKPTITKISHFFQIPASWSVTSFGLRVHCHIPLFSDQNVLQLHRLLPLPIHLTINVPGMIHSSKEIIALGQDASGTNIFSEFSNLDLSLCIPINSIKICPHASQVLLRDPYPSCLYHLYYSMHSEALQSCKIFLQPPRDTAIALSKTRFLTYTAKPKTYTLSCHSNNTRKDGLQLLGTQTLEIPHGCSAQLPLFLLNTQSDYYYSEELTVRRWTLPPSKLWNPDMTIEELNKAYEAVTADIGLPSVAPIDLSIIKSLNDPLHHSNFPTLIALGICALLLIIFIFKLFI